MKYIFYLSAIGVMLLLQKNIIFLLMGLFLWAAFIHLIFAERKVTEWVNDISQWSNYYHDLNNDPILKSIEKEYKKVSSELHDIDYRITTNNFKHKPKWLITAILNKYGLLNDFDKLLAKKEKLKQDYLMTEKLIGVDNISDKKSSKINILKNRNNSLYAGKYTLI